MKNNSPEFWTRYLEDNYSNLQRYIKNKFFDNPDTAEDIISFVSEKLVEDNMRRLCIFKGRSSHKTYFFVVIRRLISKYFEIKNGRFYPPKGLYDYLLIIVYRLLCYEKRSEDAVINILMDKGKSEAVIEESIEFIRKYYPCGQSYKIENYGDIDIEDSGHDIEITTERIKICATILKLNEKDYANLSNISKRIHDNFHPKESELLLLRMVYENGFNVTEAARFLNMTKDRGWGMMRRMLENLRDIIGDDIEDLI